MYIQNTIAAIATPAGAGGIGIIKISGPESLSIISSFFHSTGFSKKPQDTHHLYYGTVQDTIDGFVVDEVLVSYMKGPGSYTGEDVVEINCHGGLFVLQKVLDITINAGACLAEPGEFTKRAFLNGRIDLSQAEAVIDIIDSKTASGLSIASRQLKGSLSKKLEKIKKNLIEITSLLEAAIDFPEDEQDIYSSENMVHQISDIINNIKLLISTFESGRLFSIGARTVITGKPNTGKSSLLNVLLGNSRAIVTSIAGTTRDKIEETINIRGVPVKLIDTAGINNSCSEVEKIGVNIALSEISDADLVLLVLDGSSRIDDFDISIIERVRGKNVIIVLNKSDLDLNLSEKKLKEILPVKTLIRVSALLGHGIEELKEMIFEHIMPDGYDSASETLIVNARHKSSLENTVCFLNIVRNGFKNNIQPELIAVDLKESLDTLGELTGETTSEDILNEIFSRFCIGK